MLWLSRARAVALLTGLLTVGAGEVTCPSWSPACQAEQDSSSDVFLLQRHVDTDIPGLAPPFDEFKDDIKKAGEELKAGVAGAIDETREALRTAVRGVDSAGAEVVHEVLGTFESAVNDVGVYVGQQVEALRAAVPLDPEDALGSAYKNRKTLEARLEETLAGVAVALSGIKEGIAAADREVGDSVGNIPRNLIAPLGRMASHALPEVFSTIKAHISKMLNHVEAAKAATEGISKIDEQAQFAERLEKIHASLTALMPEARGIATELWALSKSRQRIKHGETAIERNAEGLATLGPRIVDHRDADKARVGHELLSVTEKLVTGLSAILKS